MVREDSKWDLRGLIGALVLGVGLFPSLSGCLLLSDLDSSGTRITGTDSASDGSDADAELVDVNVVDDTFVNAADAVADVADALSNDVVRPVRNVCGGTLTLSYMGDDARPGTSCGPFDDGILVCNGTEAVTCILASLPNECGGPGELPAPLADSCGCAGSTACDAALDGGVVCVDTVQKNACGGCAPLEGRPGFYCEDGGVSGRFVCLTFDSMVCVGGAGNACGGDETLMVDAVEAVGVFPGDECSTACGSGRFVCEGTEALRCLPDRPCNACGGMRSLAGRPGQSCGLCGGGTWQCDSPDRVVCSDAQAPNVCGGCDPLSQEPGERCTPLDSNDETDGLVLCSEGSTVCSAIGGPGAPTLNACGGSGDLLVPAGLPDAGGVAVLGEPCGACRAGEFVCDGAEAVRCTVPDSVQRNVCGGCNRITARPNTPCGTCGTGRLQCDGAERLVCQGDLGDESGRNACGGCGTLPGVPANPCGTCLSWSCEGTRLECTPHTNGPECDGLDSCDDLTCEDGNRACVESDGVIDAVCGDCSEGFVDDEEGGCRAEVTCEDLDCDEQNRWCVVVDGVPDASCGDCGAAFTADEVGGCRPIITCETRRCEDEGRLCIPEVVADSLYTEGTDSSCGGCLPGWVAEQATCRPVVTCDELDCEPQSRTCIEAGDETDAACGDCLPFTVEEGADCRSVVTCAGLACAPQLRECTEATETTDALCGDCQSGYREQDDSCIPLVTCEELSPQCALLARNCVDESIESGTDAQCAPCDPERIEETPGGNCRLPRSCELQGCADLFRDCTPESPGVDAVCDDCIEGYVDLGGVCEPVNCGGLAAPDNGLVDVPDTTFESIATYECAEGYDLIGDAVRSCDSSGTWTGTAPFCLPVDCGALSAPANGSVSAGGTTFGEERTFECAANFTLQGEVTVSCGVSGVWSAPTPFCARSLAERCNTDEECGAGAWCPTDTLPELRRCSPRLDLGDGVTMEFVFVPAGTFTQGDRGSSPVEWELPFTSTIGRNYFVGRTEVTQAQWMAATGGVNTAYFPAPPESSPEQEVSYLNAPVETVDWYSALAFSNQVSARVGADPCYAFEPADCADETSDWAEGSGDIFDCDGVVLSGLDCSGVRLPIESEWERAARGGTTTTYFWGEAGDELTVAQYVARPRMNGFGPVQVATLLPNRYGLFDIIGNVSEWVWDRIARDLGDFVDFSYLSYPTSPQVDWIEVGGTDFRGVRGSDWVYAFAEALAPRRRTFRVFDAPYYVGFRLVTTAPTPSDSLCSLLPVPDNTWLEVSSLFEGATASYDCHDGYVMVGEAERTCGSDGTWSGSEPVCLPSVDLGERCDVDAQCPDGAWCPTDTLPELRRCSPRVFEGEAHQMDFVFVPSGTFLQGTLGATDSERPYTAILSRNYWVSRTEITQGQWQSVMEAWNASPNGSRSMSGWAGDTPAFGATPSCFQTSTGSDCATGTTHLSGPVERVSSWEAAVFANVLSRQEGLPECYTFSGCGTGTGVAAVGGGCTSSVCWNGTFNCSAVAFAGPSCSGYRLLTESEWERAARGGTTTRYHWGTATDTSALGQFAWFVGNEGNRTQPVGQKLANDYALYDMSGNVGELVWDRYSVSYPPGVATDYTGPTSGSNRGERGGGFGSSAFHLRPANRGSGMFHYRSAGLGIRLARTAPAPSDTLCELVPSPANGRVAISSQFEGATATYACDDGFQVAGASVRTCLADGNWSGLEPICISETLGAACESDGECSVDQWCPTNTLPELRRCSPRLFDGMLSQLDFVLVPAGTFLQGTPGSTGNERPYTSTISRDYWVSRTEITQAQWKQLSGGRNPSNVVDDTHPVERLEWSAAAAYANALSALDGLEPCYELGPEACNLTSDWNDGSSSCRTTSFAGQACSGYRLLTEAEWEFAARGLTTSTYIWGEAADEASAEQYAWFDPNGGNASNPSASLQPNPFGLYDMLGNIEEWVNDYVWSSSGGFYAYPEGSATDYVGRSTGDSRGVRGGTFNSPISRLRSAYRRGEGAGTNTDRRIGFRLARTTLLPALSD